MILREFPPMGVYETLFKFAAATSKYMGDPGTHPWAQGYPVTTQIPGGPPLPSSIELVSTDLKYPKATGEQELRDAIAHYYRTFYGADITADHVAVFAGGRPAIWAILAFLVEGTTVAVEETEYTPYWDALRLLGLPTVVVPSNPGNRFRPTAADRDVKPLLGTERVLLLKSNPCNPTGVVTGGADLAKLVADFSRPGRAALIDEAYEFYGDPEPVSAMRHIRNIDATDLFVVGAATKGLQVPGLRVGWCIAAKRHVEIFRNWSSIAMGGISRPSQIAVTKLLEEKRVRQARSAVASFFTSQRKRYGEGLAKLGFELYTGDGGFYHWGRLPGGVTGDQFNERLFRHEAGILPGRLCDMHRRGDAGPMGRMMRFSFGPLTADSFESDLAILAKCV